MPMPTISERIAHLTAKKAEYTLEKQQVVGYMDFDDHALILPPEHLRKTVETISGSGMPIRDVTLSCFTPTPTHSNGGFYGPLGQGRNFRDFLLAHPPFIDPLCGLAGGYMCNFNSYRVGPNPDLPIPADIAENIKKYMLVPGIFAGQHFCQDLQIGLDLGWDGIRDKIAKYRALNGLDKHDFYDGLDMVVEGIQGWIEHNALYALELSKAEPDPEISAHLVNLHDINMRIAHEPPRTFIEACQFILWSTMMFRMYNGSGSLGRLDVLLYPYYKREVEAGELDDETATFLIACIFLRDTAYLHNGGYDEEGNDTTNPVSFLILEAVHMLRIPSNIGVCVGKGIDRQLLRRSVEMQFEGKTGNPRFVGADPLVEGMLRNEGVTTVQARMRTNSGCHWLAIPGREYSIMDCVKINIARVLEIALREAVEEYGAPSIEQIKDLYRHHMGIAVDTLAKGFTFSYENQIKNSPELPLDLMCHGTIEQGLDASNGGVELYLWCIDGAALAVAADSLAAVEQRIVDEGRYTFAQLIDFLDSDWGGDEGEVARLFFASVDKFGKGGSAADIYAQELTQIFTEEVASRRTPKYGHGMCPGLFSWANTIPMGKKLGATPNGRHKGEPISHGANPNPGFRDDGAATAMSRAIARVQPGRGNTAPMQIEIEPSITAEEGGVELIMALIEDHFDNGGTLINLNVIDADRVLEAHKDPSAHPDLVVRVTGFSAYFASLSPQFRQLVVDRILDKNIS
ncbi:MAG: formate acetyltransferase [Oscillospiraceae bacterium]|nr:formate acetyltransferase [Oscillospiraceae bacterium]